jgi:hypothetical protein
LFAENFIDGNKVFIWVFDHNLNEFRFEVEVWGRGEEGERGRVGEGEKFENLHCNNPIKTRGLQHLTYTHPLEEK